MEFRICLPEGDAAWIMYSGHVVGITEFDTEELLAQFHLGSMLELCVVMHHSSTITPRCKFVLECLSTVMASLLFTACLLSCCCRALAQCPGAESKTLLLEVEESRKVVCSGGSRHHMFHLPAKCTHLDAL